MDVRPKQYDRVVHKPSGRQGKLTFLFEQAGTGYVRFDDRQHPSPHCYYGGIEESVRLDDLGVVN